MSLVFKDLGMRLSNQLFYTLHCQKMDNPKADEELNGTRSLPPPNQKKIKNHMVITATQ